MGSPSTPEKRRVSTLSNTLREMRDSALLANQKVQRDTIQKNRAASFRDSVPPEYSSCTLSSSINNTQYRRLVAGGEYLVREYLESPTQFALLHGEMGLGKSIMAVSLAAMLIRQGNADSGAWVNYTDLLHQFSWASADGPAVNLGKQDILVIDDLGAGTLSLTENQSKLMFDLIERRYNDPDKITIMTTNLSLLGDGLPAILSERGWDRVRKSLTRLEFRGRSIRTAHL